MLIRYPSRDAKFCLDIQVGMLGKLTSGYIHLGVTSLWSIGSNIKENKGSRGYREAKKIDSVKESVVTWKKFC